MDAVFIRTVKRNPKDYTLSLPISILKPYNADFDGDTLNLLAFKTTEFKETFGKFFDPTKNFAISRLDGLFNTDIDLLKDQSIGVYDFCTI